MDFFEHQERARKTTYKLATLLFLSVLIIVLIIDIFIIFIINSLEGYDSIFELIISVPIEQHLAIVLSVIFLISIATLSRMFELRKGGSKVADELGASIVIASTTKIKERQLLNVIEEMAIASGIPVPQVYILDDSAINAFASGFSQFDAVICVTQGMIDLLNRDELQGVIAHEFSHIFNGDMRLNIRLVSLLFGILFLTLIGRKMVRYCYKADDLRVFFFAIFVGIGLIIVGSIGLLFGNFIKMAISRQREYLADASAVQFTRNPDGISGALKKIGGWNDGSRLHVSNAEEFSYFYFANGVRSLIFNTHPSLSKRIRKIEPGWDGYFPKFRIEVKKDVKTGKKAEKITPFSADTFKEPKNLVTIATMTSAIAATGTPTSDHVQYAKTLISEIPEPLLLASRETMTAYALVLGLLMDKELLKNMSEQDKLLKGIDKEICKQLRKILSMLIPLNIKYRLPLIELAIPSLKSLSQSQLEQFEQHMLLIIKHDNRVEFWEWALHWIITQSLNKPIVVKPRYDNFTLIENECAILLSATVYTASSRNEVGKEAYNAAANEIGISIELVEKNKINSSDLLNALAKVRELKPLVKPRFLKALSLAAQHDGVIEPEEIEFIRAIAEGIDCPMPPLIDKLESS